MIRSIRWEPCASAAFAAPPDLRTGAALHAFDHLHGYAEQAETAAACGATVIYATGLGMDGYTGIPEAETWEAHRAQCRAYNDWLSDLCADGEGRLHGVAVLPHLDPIRAAAEIARVAAEWIAGLTPAR